METREIKEELRRSIRAARTAMTESARTRAGEAFAHVVAELPQVRDAAVIAAYVSRPTEPPTLPLLERLAARGTRILLPVLGSGLQRDWAWYTGPGELQVQAPGRPAEPPGPTLGAGALAQVDAIVAPALAVDSEGRRLGQGGGWYDRVLEHAPEGACIVAMVFPDEVYDAAARPLPSEEHDHRVDIAATPAGWQWLRRPPSA